MGKLVGTLRLRFERKAQREERIRAVFKSTNKRLENAKREAKRKKKTPTELLDYLSIVDPQLIERRICDIERFIPRSHNLNKQIRSFIDHLFVKYPVPEFMYGVFFESEWDRLESLRGTYQLWFLALAQGASFVKLAKGTMTAKEAVIFLKAPTDLTVDENVWWAKLAAAGVPSAMARSITTSILWRIVPGGHERKFDELISFFARFHAAIDPKQFDNLTQFLDWKLSEDEPFYLKGRTPASVLKLAAEWRRLYRGNSYGTLIAWEGLGCRPWTRYLKTTICDIVELRTNRQLMDEGRKQRNCVFTYVSNCVSADSAIFSLRAHSGYVAMCDKNSQEPAMEKVNEIYRLTIEVAPQRREIVQIKARLNNSADDEQLKIVKDWAALNGLKFSKECEL